MEIFFYFFIVPVLIINISFSVFESLNPVAWLKNISRLLSRPLLVKSYGFFLVVLVICFSTILIYTGIFTRLRFFLWIITAYIALNSLFFLFSSQILKETLEIFEKECSLPFQKSLVYLDSFLRLVASLIIIASMMP